MGEEAIKLSLEELHWHKWRSERSTIPVRGDNRTCKVISRTKSNSFWLQPHWSEKKASGAMVNMAGCETHL